MESSWTAVAKGARGDWGLAGHCADLGFTVSEVDAMESSEPRSDVS